MRIEEISIQMNHGSCETYIINPDGPGRIPNVLFLTDAIGLRTACLEVAQELASFGYRVFVPNIFWRVGPVPTIPNLPSKLTLDQFRAIYPKLQECIATLPPENQISDTKLYLAFMKGYDPGPSGIVGFCFGGRMGLRMAAEFPDDFKFAASIHGGKLIENLDVLPKIKAQLYLGHAVDDASNPKPAIKILEDALNQTGIIHETEVLNAHHGFAMPDTPAYKLKARAQVMTKMVHWLKRSI